MGNEESNYKRIEDQEWRKSVESRLVSLTSAQKQTDDDIDKTDKRIEDLEILLEGDPLKRNDSGLKGDAIELDRGLSELRSIMAPDALGNGGVKNRLSNCEAALGLRIQKSGNRTQVLIAAIGGTALITGAIFGSLDHIEKFIKSYIGKPVVATSSKSRNHTGKTSKRRPRPAVSEAPMEATDDGRANEEMSHGWSGNGSDAK